MPTFPRNSSTSPKLRVATIFLRYGTEKYTRAETDLDEIFARFMPGIERTTVVVDNQLPSHVIEHSGSGRTVLGGDNRYWEFSAWDKGVAFLGSSIWSYDLIHFATSAFRTLYVKYLDRFSETMLRAIAGRPVCLGHIDYYNDPVRVFSFHSQYWLRTSFFFLPPVEIKALGSLVSVRNPQPLFSGNPKRPFRDTAPLSQSYQRYILDWLTGPGTDQATEWHSRFKLDARTLPYFEEKALTLLNEHLLSIRLRALGCHAIDTTWLATALAQQPPETIPWNPDWRSQLAGRDTDSVPFGRPIAIAQSA